jgi:RHS repeat-associated protein
MGGKGLTRTTRSHDDLVRIAGANCGSAAAQTFSYDPFGNISKSGSPYSFHPTYSAATNRFATLPGGTPTYDADGNVTYDGSHNYSSDADGNSISIDTTAFTFDALDRMVEQNRSGSYTQVVYSPGGGKLALMNGQVLTKAVVPLPGQAAAVYTSAGLDHYRHSDWLGSARLTSSPSRTYVSSVAYAPYGEMYAQSGSTDFSFTGMNPDTVSADYDFLYREYSTQGRWPSPDPSGLAAVDPSNPQSWNRYSYVRNIPLISIDPTGMFSCLTVENHSHADRAPAEVGLSGGPSLRDSDSSDPDQGSNCLLTPGDTWVSIDGGGFVSLDSGSSGLLSAGSNSMVQCPNNTCSGFGTNANGDTRFVDFMAFASGISGYFYGLNLSNGLNELNGKLYTDAAYKQLLGQGILESQQAAIAKKLSALTGKSYEEAYNSLTVKVGQPVGGNYNFTISPTMQQTLSDLNVCDRCGNFDSLDFTHSSSPYETVHLDTANPLSMFGFGALVHFVVDLWLGNTQYQVAGIPRH